MRKWLLTLAVTCMVVTAGTGVAAIVETIVWETMAGEWPYPSITQLATDNRIETITLVVCIVSGILSMIFAVILFALESKRESKRLG